jgi:heterodisulfide reductase subunit A2
MNEHANEAVTTPITKKGSVLIVGGGIGGMQAALDLANSGFKVHMLQKESSIGGAMVMLDKTFPTGDCSMCMISPKMVEVGRHPNVDIHTLTEVVDVNGEPGNFTVKVKQQPRYVIPDKCTGCGVCEDKCPKLVPSEFEQQLGKRKAIFSLLPQAVPNTRVIDAEQCLFLQRGRCKACEKFCTAGAIDFDDPGKEFDLNIGAIILSPGLERYNPRVRQELGYSFGFWTL